MTAVFLRKNRRSSFILSNFIWQIALELFHNLCYKADDTSFGAILMAFCLTALYKMIG